MHHIVYISAATRNFSSEELGNILNSARANNRLAGITGLLMYHDGQFFQVLEGQKDVVEACFENILKDDRHTGVITLMNQSCERRSFAGWNMGLAQLSQFEGEAKSDFLDLLNAHNSSEFSELHRDKVIGVFADTFLADITRLRGSMRL